MSLFTSETITRFLNAAETEISIENPFLVDRISLPVTMGVSVYTLPDYILGIRRVTFQGNKLNPLMARNEREIFQSGNQVATPFWYIFNNVGQNKIKLFPTPATSIGSVTGLWDTGIPNGFIIEFNRASDNVDFTVPPYFRRQLLKQYVAKMTFAIEGQGQNIKLSQYYDKKWGAAKANFINWLNDIHTLPRRLVVNSTGGSHPYPGYPQLPISRFGIGVDE